jgi:two-component system, OmpR family, sensor kinase
VTIQTAVSAVRAWSKAHVKLHVVVALTVFVVTLGASLYYWSNIRDGVNADMQATYERQVRGFGVITGSRLQMHQNLLNSGVGLFAVDGEVTQADWETYFAQHTVNANYPEIQGIGFSRYVPAAELPAFLQEQAARNNPGYTISPAGPRDVYMPVVFNARFTGNNGKSPGYDGLTDPRRRKGIETAIETGKPAMSGKVQLVSESREGRNAFIVYMPVYKKGMPTDTPEQRRAATYGVVYTAIDIATLLDGVPQLNKNVNVALQIYDPSLPKEESLAYESANYQEYLKDGGGPSSDAYFEIFGHRWLAKFASPATIISAPERELPAQALWRGILMSFLFAGLVWYLITNRERKYFREVQTAKDDLLSLASHQLRTPATVVKQYVGMLLQGYVGKLTRQQKVMLENAYESNERQLEIINQLLYVARLDAGRIKLRKENTDLSRLIRDVAKDQSQNAKDRHQLITYNLPKQPVRADIDPQYMRMVLENLLSNAIKYTPEHGSIGLSVRKSQGEALVAVTDTGVGIDAEDQPRVFEKFTRVENVLSTDVNGSGVGLYLTREIAELHGGEIEVQSRHGEGSTFIVHIPLEAPNEHKGV